MRRTIVKSDPAKQRAFLLRVEAAMLDQLRAIMCERVELQMRPRKRKARESTRARGKRP
jgi:hypothetical protein